MKKCKKCKNKNLKEALFCENCGAPIKNKRYLPLILGVAAVCAIFIIGIFVSTKFFSPYDRYVDMGYKLMDKGDIQGAVEAFDEAIKLNAKRTKAFVGKIKAYSKTDGENTAENISDTAKEGYEKTESEEIVDAVEEVEKELLGAGRGAVAYEMLKNLEGIKGFERFEESIKGTEESIIKAYKEILSKIDIGFYILYDIDKNRIPELIIEEDFPVGDASLLNDKPKTFVYTFEDSKAIKAGELEEFGSYASIPNKNGMLYFVYNEYDEFEVFIATLEGNAIKTEAYNVADDSIDYEGMYYEIGPSDIVKGSEWLYSDSVEHIDCFENHFAAYIVSEKTYSTHQQAYKEFIGANKNMFENYLIYDVDKDGVEEIAVLNNICTGGWYVADEVYHFVDGKIKYIGELFGDGYYESEEAGILCKRDGGDSFGKGAWYELRDKETIIEGEVIEGECVLLGYKSENDRESRGDDFRYKDKTITEEEFLRRESALKEIPIYPIDDLSAIEALD